MATMFILVSWVILLFDTGFSDMVLSPSPITENWYSQPLDHFTSGVENTNRVFQQRAILDKSFRRGKPVEDGTPILVYFGGEGNIDVWLDVGGILTLVASQYDALVVFIEHRFYGQSVPLGSIDAAMMDPSVRGCLTTEQALADFANVIVSLQSDMSIPHSPVIVFGGYYSGMLAAWFRMRYPHIADGALASSAPVLGSQDLAPEQQYCSIVSRDFETTDERCYDTISRSWQIIDEVAAEPGGLESLSWAFSTCRQLSTTDELKEYLTQVYNYVAQYNGPYNEITGFCYGIVSIPQNDILKRIGDAILMYTKNQICNNISNQFSSLDPPSAVAWNWQVCSELVPHQGCVEFTMFPRRPFELLPFAEDCYKKYGEYPHIDRIPISYGKDMKSAFKKSSNIIFSNGLLDPFSGASILEDLSETVLAITTKEGSHCSDLNPRQSDDPEWLIHQRTKELKIIGCWIEASISYRNKIPSLGHVLIICICLII